MALHKAHQSVLDCIESYWNAHKMSPTVQEIESEMTRSRGSIQNSLNRLKENGYITWIKYKSRTIRLLSAGPKATLQSTRAVPKPSASFLDSVVFSEQGLPVLGEIAAGNFHQPLTDEIDEYLDINYSGRKPSDYVLRISGKSMIGAGIPDGSYVGIRPVLKDYSPRPGEIVAVWVDGEGATLKHYYQKDSTVVLEAANPDYKPIILDLKTTEVTVKGTHIFTHWQTPGI